MLMKRLRRTALVPLLSVATVGVVAPVAAAQDCSGTLSASVTAESLPGGEWAVEGACLHQDSFYEFSDGPVLAKAGVAEATYTDGHQGRVAAAVLTLGNGVGLGIVGVEDAATGLIKFSAVLGDFTSVGDRVTVAGEGVALLPVERATVSAAFSGTGTDVSGLLEGSLPEASDVPGALGDQSPLAELPTVPASTVPAATVPEEPTTTTSTTVSPDSHPTGAGDGSEAPPAGSGAPATAAG